MLVLKKYNNRKLYGEIDGKKGYLTLTDFMDLIRQGKEVQVLKHNKGQPDHGQDVTLDLLKESLTRLVIPSYTILELINRYKTED